MTRQTDTPLKRLPMSTSNRQARWLVRQMQDGDLDINPPYQRGSVWSNDQRVALMWSLLSGIPIPSVIINDRHGEWWTDTSTYDPSNPTGPSYAVVDGKQRILTMAAWYSGELAIPASWIPSNEIGQVEDTQDGPYVRATGLTDLGRRMTGERIHLAISDATVGSLRAEAQIYLLVNGAGTIQTESDMANAARVAGSAS